jgi:hypothetical protein
MPKFIFFNFKNLVMGWIQITVNGNNFDFYHQDLPMECGPSCVAMVAKANGQGISIDGARQGVRNAEHHIGGFNRDYVRDASAMTSLSQALSDRGVHSAHLSQPGGMDAFKAKMRGASLQHPAILHVYLPRGHFIVCVGETATAGIFYLVDPAFATGLIRVNANSVNGYIGYNRSAEWQYLNQGYIITTN